MSFEIAEKLSKTVFGEGDTLEGDFAVSDAKLRDIDSLGKEVLDVGEKILGGKL